MYKFGFSIPDKISAYPLFDFKIGLLYSDKIGRFLGNTEFYLRKKSLEKKKIPIHIYQERQ